ncbi:MAG: carbohydrate ABC transporter permease [Anaerolineaceae bacterium]|nr:carbohydrate ABC transporter permease [Anaerolineaceae bacterium]
MRASRINEFLSYLVLSIWSLIVLFPIWTLIVNSLKSQKGIFADPFGLPKVLSFDGYLRVLGDSNFPIYFANTMIVVGISLILILFFGSLAAYAMASWDSWVTTVLYVFFIAGLMIPIRIATIDLVRLMIQLKLQDTIWSLIPVYVAMGMPIATFILTTFIREIPKDIFEAARIDGASRFRIYLRIVVPLVRPALATVAIFNMVKIWNDFWFPLVFIRAEESRTVALGVSLLFGQYRTDWTTALSTLSLAAIPILVLYVLLSKEFIKGLTAGAVKG